MENKRSISHPRQLEAQAHFFPSDPHNLVYHLKRTIKETISTVFDRLRADGLTFSADPKFTELDEIIDCITRIELCYNEVEKTATQSIFEKIEELIYIPRDSQLCPVEPCNFAKEELAEFDCSLKELQDQTIFQNKLKQELEEYKNAKPLLNQCKALIDLPAKMPSKEYLKAVRLKLVEAMDRNPTAFYNSIFLQINKPEPVETDQVEIE